jgi:serine/threonine protein kinase
MFLAILIGLTGRYINDKYLLKELLGYGGDSVVFRAETLGSDQPINSVAIKLIGINANKEDEQIKELEIATTLKHKSLINCHEFFRVVIDNNPIFGLVMEFAEESLEQYLDRLGDQPLDLSEREAIIDSTLQALSFIHSKNIVHRDIKPGNILKVGKVWKVADFGISRVLDTKTSTQTMERNGTFLFMPPEASDGIISSAWDMWSLGILIARLFSKNHPFLANNEVQFFHKVQYEPPILPENLNILYQTIIQGCLIKSRTDRWKILQVLEYFQIAKENARNEATIEDFRQKIHEEIEDLKQYDDYHSIIGLCNILIYLKPNCIDAWQNKADAYFCLGQTQECLETYRLALHRLAEGFQVASSSINASPRTIEKGFSSMAKPGIELSNDDHLQELVTGETQPSEQKKRMLRTITESMRARAQSLSRLVKKRKDKT